MRSADALVVDGDRKRGRLDLGRQVYALLGFAFDAVDLDQTVELLRRCVDDRTPCFLTTANLNFVVSALGDAAFRQTALRSDLCVADGMPIVWIARLMGVPIKYRVTGADLFECLRDAPRPADGRAIKIYLFGGPPGAAARACASVNALGGLLECVGFEAPGYVSVEAMSTREQIARVNDSGAHFVVAALGAVKGQAWLEHNRDSLRAPLRSHLGAVINFEAGTVSRAPRWAARAGLEWAWRIAQEPTLWRRYSQDALVAGRLLVKTILPWAAMSLANTWKVGPVLAPRFAIEDSNRVAVFRLQGAWTHDAMPPLRRAIADCLNRGRNVQLDLSSVTAIDSACVGLLLVFDAWQWEPRALTAGSVANPIVARALRAFGAAHLSGIRAATA